MKIKFTELDITNGEKAGGEIWTAYKVKGTKLEDGAEWSSGNIFDNKHNTDVINKAKTLEVGDKVDVKHVKNGKFWNVSDIVPVSDQEAANMSNPRSSSGSGKASTGSRAKGDQMTKEEWAAKNEVDRIRIAKSVALKAAVENSKANEKPEKVIEMAQAFMPFLTDDVLPLNVNIMNDGDDPLDPPA